MELELRAKPAARSGGVEDSIRHLTYEDLEAYLAGRLPSARLKHCGTHLDSCEACRAELEDLRTFKSDLAGFARTEPNRRERQRGRRRRGLTLPLAAAVATIVVAGIAAVLWWGRERPHTNKTSVAVTVTHSVAPVPAAGIQTRDTRLADEIAALPADVRPAVSDAIQQGKLRFPTDLSQFRERAQTLSGARDANTGFALLDPVGEAIAETRPELRWQPLAGAIRYSVAIVDAGLHPVQRSPALRTTGWRPRRPLRRGRTYLWQVTATLRGGSTVVASGPLFPEALLRIIPSKLADELAQFRHGHEEAHLVLGALYAQAGMLTDSAAELRKVLPGDSSYGTAEKLLESLPSGMR
jgi:predicted anti-sigma-YlaC factor YlaD